MPRKKHTLTEAELAKLQNIVADYSRVSTDKDDQLNSLENQLYYFKNAAKDRGKIHYKSYYDEGLTGTKLNNREGFNQMLRDAGIDVVDQIDPRTMKKRTSYYISEYRNPKFGQIWVKNTSRFARNTFSFEIIQILRRNNVYVYFLEQNLLTDDTTHDFELKLYQNFDENESRSKGKKVRWGYARGAEKGMVYVGKGLYGFDIDREKNTLTPNADAPTVALIYKLYIEGMGIRKIREYLFEKGIKPAKGGEKWGYTSLKNLLHNEKYAGYNNPLKWDSGEVFVDKHYSKKKETYRLYKCDRITPIISKETFDKAQAVCSQRCDDLKNPTKGRKVSYSKYNQMLYCYNCGSHYIRNQDYYDTAKTRKYFTYCCGRKRKEGTKYCNAKNVKEEVVDMFIKQLARSEAKKEIEKYRGNYNFMLLCVASYLLEEIDPDVSSEAEKILFNIEETRSKLDAATMRAIEHPEFNAHGALDRIITQLNAQLDELQGKYEELNAYNSNIYKEAIALVECYKELEAADENIKDRYSESEIIAMLERIWVEERDGEVHLIPVFRYYYNAEQLLKKYEKKYNFRTENLQRAKIPDGNIKDINAYYLKVSKALDGIYTM